MKVKVNLSLQEKSDAEAIIDGKQIVLKMTGNPNFDGTANPVSPSLSVVTTAIDELESALAIAQKAGPAATKVLREKRLVLDTYLTKLGHYVEDTANDPAVTDDKREGIVVSAGMMVKAQTSHQKQHFDARNTQLSGTVRLVAEGIGRGAHEWQYTTDVTNFTNRVPVASTTTAHTDIHGLVSGTKYAFFHKEIVAGRASDWEGPVFLMVV
jgi:hypothetical protein